MIDLSISVEGLFGLTWPQWKRLVQSVEDFGFAGLYLSDHFNMPEPTGDYPSLELIVALTYLADHTARIRFGPMVSPVSVREPVMLARQAAALHDLSDGRMILGVGTGHFVREHDMFGYDLGGTSTRFTRLEEGLEVITRLLRSDAPVTVDGRFFKLRAATLPGPRQPGSPLIMIGGSGPKRTLPLVARFADVWNALGGSPEQVRERSVTLDRLLDEVGRRLEDVQRTLTVPVVCWRTPAELEARLSTARRFPIWRDQSTEQIVESLRSWPALVGTPEEVIAQIRAFEAVGIREIAMQWTAADDIEGLEMLATEVLPQFAQFAA